MADINRNDLLRLLEAGGPIPAKFRVRDASTVEFTAANPVLEEGEIAADPATGEQWIGDGTTPFNSLPRPYPKKGSVPVNVLDFAVTEAAARADPTVIQTAVNSLPDQGGTVTIPHGLWVTAPVSLKQGTHLRGSSKHNTVLESAAPMGSVLIGHSNTIIEHLRIQGKDQVTNGILYDSNFARAHLNAVRVEHCKYGVASIRSQNGHYQDVYVEDCWRSFVFANGASNNSMFACSSHITPAFTNANGRAIWVGEDLSGADGWSTTLINTAGCRNNRAVGGIFEGGGNTIDHQVEVEGGGLFLFGTEITGSEVALIRVGAGGQAGLVECTFSMSGGSKPDLLATLAQDGGEIRVHGGTYENVPRRPAVVHKPDGGHITGAGHVPRYPAGSRFLDTSGFTAAGSATISFNATTRSIDCTSPNTSNHVLAPNLGTESNPPVAGRMYEIRIHLSNVTDGPIRWMSGNPARVIRTLTDGYHHFAYPAVTGDRLFMMSANSGSPASWSIDFLDITLR